MSILDRIRKTERMIDFLRRKYPQYTWRYNAYLHRWVCGAGYVMNVAAFAPRYDGDDDTFITETWFYFYAKGKRPERVWR